MFLKKKKKEEKMLCNYKGLCFIFYVRPSPCQQQISQIFSRLEESGLKRAKKKKKNSTFLNSRTSFFSKKGRMMQNEE
jgi:hypothetical protein